MRDDTINAPAFAGFPVAHQKVKLPSEKPSAPFLIMRIEEVFFVR